MGNAILDTFWAYAMAGAAAGRDADWSPVRVWLLGLLAVAVRRLMAELEEYESDHGLAGEQVFCYASPQGAPPLQSAVPLLQLMPHMDPNADIERGIVGRYKARI